MTKRNLETRRFSKRACFTIIIRCMEAPAAHPDWKDKEWVRADDPVRIVGHNSAYRDGDFELVKGRAAASAQRIARMIQCNEGGAWVGRLRDSTNDPYPERRMAPAERRAMDQHVLNGPDGPGRRFLQMLRDRPNASKLGALAWNLKGVPAAGRSRTMDTRAMVERMQSYQPNPDAGPSDNSDLWESKDDLATATDSREPGEDE
jgi:hypothetical protein